MPEKKLDSLLSLFSQTQPVYFATYDGKYPKVRPVTLICEQSRLYIATGAGDAKVKQLRDFPSAEFCYMLTKDKFSGYIRISGNTEFVTDPAVKNKMFQVIPFLKQYFESPENPGFTLIRIDPVRAEYMEPGEMTAQKYYFK